VNLPNGITLGRILVSPGLALLALAPAWPLRFLAFWLFVIVAVTDYLDGKLARDYNMVTNLGRLLDPLADKVLLAAGLMPMFLLQGTVWDTRVGASLIAWVPPAWRESAPFVTPFGQVGLPLWVLLIVAGREIFMTAFRQVAAARGVVISAIVSAKFKTGFQWIWIGTAFFWFAAVRAAQVYGWDGNRLWHAAELFIGTVGLIMMTGALSLTLWSLGLYMVRYGGLFAHRTDHHRG